MVQKFKNTLRYHRKILGLTLKEVAKMLKHKNVSRLSKWEHGISTPNHGRLRIKDEGLRIMDERLRLESKPLSNIQFLLITIQ